jgi:hypothetical protein
MVSSCNRATRISISRNQGHLGSVFFYKHIMSTRKSSSYDTSTCQVPMLGKVSSSGFLSSLATLPSAMPGKEAKFSWQRRATPESRMYPHHCFLLSLQISSQVGFPGGSDVKESVCNAGDLSSISGLGRCPRGGNGNPLQHSCLENSTERGVWWSTVRLSD